MKNQAKCKLLPLKEQDDAINTIIFNYFSNTKLLKYAEKYIDNAPLRRIKYSKEQLDEKRRKADEMGLPDTLDCLNE
jgi:hypothetical protein